MLIQFDVKPWAARIAAGYLVRTGALTPRSGFRKFNAEIQGYFHLYGYVFLDDHQYDTNAQDARAGEILVDKYSNRAWQAGGHWDLDGSLAPATRLQPPLEAAAPAERIKTCSKRRKLSTS